MFNSLAMSAMVILKGNYVIVYTSLKNIFRFQKLFFSPLLKITRQISNTGYPPGRIFCLLRRDSFPCKSFNRYSIHLLSTKPFYMPVKTAFTVILLFYITLLKAQPDPWKVKADKIDASNYYGVTVANGMIGIVSSPEPFKVKDVVLAGAYDLYGRGRVSNFLRSFNLLNMRLEIDGHTITAKDATHFQQELDMRHASFTTSFEYSDKASVTYTYYSLRHLPYTVLMDISITAKKDISLNSASVMEAPDALKDVQNYYNEIDRPHVVISLLTSSGRSISL